MQHQHRVLVDHQVLVIDAGVQVIVIFEHHRRAGVFQQMRLRCGRLDHRAVGCEIAAQHREAAAGRQRIAAFADHVVVVDLCVFKILTQRAAIDGGAIEVQQILQLRHHRAQTTGVIKILHQIFIAGGPDIGQHRRALRQFIETFEIQRHPGATRHRHQMDQRIGRTRQRMNHGDRIIERLRREDFGRLQVIPYHFNDTTPAGSGHACMVGIRCRNRSRRGQCQAQGFRDGSHRRCRAHGHAVPIGARNAFFDFSPFALADGTGAQFRPVFPGIAARTQRLAVPVAAQHRSGRHINERQAHRGCAHDQCRRCFVTAAHQHGTVDRITAQ